MPKATATPEMLKSDQGQEYPREIFVSEEGGDSDRWYQAHQSVDDVEVETGYSRNVAIYQLVRVVEVENLTRIVEDTDDQS